MKLWKRFWEWMFEAPVWLSTLIFLFGVLTILVAATSPLMIMSAQHSRDLRIECESKGGELLRATSKSGTLTCVQRGTIIELEGK